MKMYAIHALDAHPSMILYYVVVYAVEESCKEADSDPKVLLCHVVCGFGCCFSPYCRPWLIPRRRIHPLVKLAGF
jgi:hypothetical protein